MANVTYTVKKGDTLSQIALDHGTTVSALVKLNNISNPNYIVVGQVLIISGTAAPKRSNNPNQVTINAFGLQSRTERTLYANWEWGKQGQTEHYEVKWIYYTGDTYDGKSQKLGFVEKSTVNITQALYTPPDNADYVAFCVKPISKTYTTEDGEEGIHFTAQWSTYEYYYLKNAPPKTPPVPSVEIKDYKLTAEVTNLDINAASVQFQIVKNDSSVFKTGTAKIQTTSASYSCTVTAGAEYKVRCRGVRDGLYSEWSEYSENLPTIPAASAGITSLKALTETSLYISWSKVANAEGYEIEYTSKKSYFDSNPAEVKSVSVESVVNHAEITGLEAGNEWFFRVRATNDQGSSKWTAIKSIILGEAPDVPTTWSSTTTVMVGEPLTLYWTHNSEDGSSQTYAQLELDIGGKVTTQTIKNSTDEDEKDKTSHYSVSTSGYTEGTTIKWRVKTRGITSAYSDWSIQRTVDIYAPPTAELSVTDSDGNPIELLGSFPFYISVVAGPNTQTPIGYHISVIANSAYETTDNIGNAKLVKAGEEVYSQYFDTATITMKEMLPSDVNLDNNVGYTVKCTVSMNSGLTAEDSYPFTVAWSDDYYAPDADIFYDSDTYVTHIRPFSSGGDNITLSVYRREYDGTFTEIATGLDNSKNTYVTDPHPALDYARYRVVATSNETGAVSYSDIPGYPIGEKAVIIQWDEDWSTFDTDADFSLLEPLWAGSLLRLPYNIDVSDKHSSDVSLIEYIGRKHPVSYYGTQLGESSTWNVEIDRNDKETLYALRRLAIWMGDVYVREPSGSGYWANISVSFSQKHCEVTIPVTLELTRVAGGI